MHTLEKAVMDNFSGLLMDQWHCDMEKPLSWIFP